LGGAADVSSGAVWSDTTIDGGHEHILSGGIATVTFVGSFGTQGVGAGGLALDTTIGDDGVVFVSAGAAAVGTVVQSGGSEVVVSGGLAGGVIVSSGAILDLDSGASATNITQLSGGTINLIGLAYVSGGTANLDPNTDVLTIHEGSNTVTLQMSGSYTGEYFHLSNVEGATLLTLDDVPCYCAGTLILTDQGEKPVETLAVGDGLVTASGQTRTLRWIGQRAYSGVFARNNPRVLPVCIARGALGDGLPRRDLHVSPLHAMFIDGVLVPAGALVNDVNIVQMSTVDTVRYFHLELDTHDVIVAEGAFSETFVDDGSRGMFHNAAEYDALYPDAPRQPALYCAPRVEDGPVLDRIRRRLTRRQFLVA
jgi:autotransporter passenger strand-loop-strand repeat protein